MFNIMRKKYHTIRKKRHIRSKSKQTLRHKKRTRKGGALPIYHLRSWIPLDILNIPELCKNPHPAIVPILEKIWELQDTRANKSIDWFILSSNPVAVSFLKQHLDYINWSQLAKNPNPDAIELLMKNPSYIYWKYLVYNPEGIKAILQNKTLLNKLIHDKRFDKYWYDLSAMPEAMPLLTQFPERVVNVQLAANPSPEALPLLSILMKHIRPYENIQWYIKRNGLSQQPPYEEAKLWEQQIWFSLCWNPSPEAMNLVAQHIVNPQNDSDIHWERLSTNPFAKDILLQYPDKVDYNMLSINPSTETVVELYTQHPERIDNTVLSAHPSKEAIQLLLKNPERIHWETFSSNPAAIEVLEQKQNYVNWDTLSSNPAIFDYDYPQMQINMINSKFFEQLQQNRAHPKNIHKFEEWGWDNEESFNKPAKRQR